MSFLVIGDIHLDNYPDFGVDSEGFSNRLRDMEKGLHGYLHQAVLLHATHLVFTGDIFDNRSQIHADCIIVWGQFLMACKEKEKIVVVVKGNHDQYTETRSALQGFMGMTLVEHPKALKLGDLKLFCIPYNKSTACIQKSIQKAVQLKADVIVGHFGLGDVELQKGFCEKDVPFSSEIPEDGPQVVLGHYHCFKEVRKGIQFIGAPVGKTFDEANQPKYIVLIQGKKGFKRIPVDWVKQLKEVVVTKETGKIPLDIANFYYKVKVEEGCVAPVHESIVKTQMIKENSLVTTINKSSAFSNKQVAQAWILANPPEDYKEEIVALCEELMEDVECG